MKRVRVSWDALLVASVVIVAGLCTQSQQAVLAEDEPQGRIVQIAPGAEDLPADETETIKAEVVEDPGYWIGIRGRGVESPVLRTHLQLAEDMGVVIEEVVADSPADKAGLRKHDILLRANGEAVYGMNVLQDHVVQHGAKPIELTLIRLGKEEKIAVVPEKRPASAAISRPDRLGRGRQNRFDGRSDALQKMLEQLQEGGALEGGIRMFGPGMFLQGNAPGMDSLPNGVSVSASRSNDGLAKITVKRGEETWELDGDDDEALEQLPEELRGYVGRMMQRQDVAGQLGGLDWEAELEQVLPRGLGGLRGGGFEFGGGNARDRSAEEKELAERLDLMERQLLELQKRLSEE